MSSILGPFSSAATLAASILCVAGCGGGDTGSGKGASSQGGSGQGGQVGGAAATGGSTAVFLTGGTSGGGAPPAECLPTGAVCENTRDCCDGNVCNQTGQVPEWIGCKKSCTESSQCTEGCCLLFEGSTSGFCTDAKWCAACGTTGIACGSMFPACCTDHFCVGDDPQGESFSCRKRCSADTDCAVGCCLEVVAGVKACLDPMYCPVK